MRLLTDHLAQYAAYHRDRRNLVTHLVGIPLIVVAVTTLLGRPTVAVAGVALSPALGLAIVAVAFYLALDLRFGAAMAVFIGASVWAGRAFAAQSTTVWLAAGLGLFVVGWVVQFVGHHYEGRKPAFVDDLVGLLIGPLFIVAETAFAFGMRPEVLAEVERRVGPMRTRHAAAGRAD